MCLVLELTFRTFRFATRIAVRPQEDYLTVLGIHSYCSTLSHPHHPLTLATALRTGRLAGIQMKRIWLYLPSPTSIGAWIGTQDSSNSACPFILCLIGVSSCLAGTEASLNRTNTFNGRTATVLSHSSPAISLNSRSPASVSPSAVSL